MFTKEFPLFSLRGWENCSHQSRISGDLKAGDNSFRWLCPLERGLCRCTPQTPCLWHGIGRSSHSEDRGYSVLLLRKWFWQYSQYHFGISGVLAIFTSSISHLCYTQTFCISCFWCECGYLFPLKELGTFNFSESYSLRQCHDLFAVAIKKIPKTE